MNKLLQIFLLLFIPTLVFTQNLKIREIKPFIDFEGDNYNSVVDSLDNLIKNDPKPEFYLLQAKTYFKLGDYEKSLEICNRLDKIKPNYASDLKFRIYLSLNSGEKAEEVFKENLKSFYKISLYDLLNSEMYSEIYSLNLDDKILSENYYTQTEKQLYQVERFIENRKYTQALFIADEIISRDWDISEAHYFKSIILFKENDLQGAKKEINLAISLKKSNREYYAQRVNVLAEFKDYEQALLDINKLIRMDPYQIDHYIQKAELLFKANYFDEAKKLTESILEVQPNNPDVMYLGSKTSYMNEDYLGALKQINGAFEYKSSKEFYELRGDIYSATETFKYAIQDYSMYLDIYPRSGDVYAKKGLARFNLGDKKGACSDWEKAKRYGSYEAIEYLDRYCDD